MGLYLLEDYSIRSKCMTCGLNELIVALLSSFYSVSSRHMNEPTTSTQSSCFIAKKFSCVCHSISPGIFPDNPINQKDKVSPWFRLHRRDRARRLASLFN